MTSSSPIPAKAYPGWLRQIASPVVPFYILPWVMILLTLGTYAQKDMGLYAAQKLFFSSWLIFLGPIPLPGMCLTLAVLTASLLLKFLLFSPWRKHQAGIILCHLGILILLLGGLITFLSQKESFLMLREGSKSRSIADYHQRVLRLEKNGEPWKIIPFEDLSKATDLAAMLDIPFNIEIDTLCQNCRPVMTDKPEGRHGFAQKVTLVPVAADKDNEANLSGMIFRLSGLEAGQDGFYLVVEEIPFYPEVTHGKDTYKFFMGRAQQDMPFSIEMKDFKQELHPGTNMARGFSSDIVVHDGDIDWPYTISMNEPLRYKGYTFYQSSFTVRTDGEYSILSVVQNDGRIFPYLASAVIFCGLLLHLIIRISKKADS
jgi:hypothetical protein